MAIANTTVRNNVTSRPTSFVAYAEMLDIWRVTAQTELVDRTGVTMIVAAMVVAVVADVPQLEESVKAML